jgi:hypothetical protein
MPTPDKMNQCCLRRLSPDGTVEASKALITQALEDFESAGALLKVFGREHAAGRSMPVNDVNKILRKYCH